MECLLDMPGCYLILKCEPCGRYGRYRLDRLRERFGELTDVYTVYVALTQSCRYQHRNGMRRPNQYGVACRARMEDDGTERARAPRSRM